MDFRTACSSTYSLLRDYARENRKNATLAEQVLWEQLRSNSLGIKFLRQHIVGEYIVDFISREGGLVIEVDGGYHAEPRQKEDDLQREQALERMGFHVIRFTNEEVLYNTKYVLEQIENNLK